MAERQFNEEELAYLRSLPAVARVSHGRIRYTEEFKRECMRRYEAGDSPSQIFRDAGLDSALIGYKRIERSIARWHKELLAERKAAADGRAAKATKRMEDEEPFTPRLNVRDGRRDLRDMLIAQQIHHIDALERQIAKLEAERLGNAGGDDGDDAKRQGEGSEEK